MRAHLCGPRFLLAIFLLVLPGLALANDITADCTGTTPGAATSINQALLSLPLAGPNSIYVIGTCTENVTISGRTQLTIFANPGTATLNSANPNRRLLVMFDSSQVFIDGLNFDGGRGILVFNSTDITFGDTTIQNSGLQGLSSTNSTVDIFNATVQNNARVGVLATGGNLNVDGGVTITNNARSGIGMLTGHLNLSGGDGAGIPPNVISNNGSAGISLANSAELDAGGDNRILNNGLAGLQAIHTTTVIWDGGSISGNQGVGVHIGETSHGEFSNVSITGNGATPGSGGGGIASGSGAAGGIEVVENSDGFIDGGVDVSGNLATGVFVDESSVFSSLGGNTVNNNAGDGFLITNLAVAHFFAADTATGNTLNGLQCDDSSIVIGSTAGFGKLSCARVRIK